MFTLRLSPFHTVEISETYAHLIDKPPAKDFALHTIALKKAPDGRPLVHSELVIAGRATREAFPLAKEFPVHFLKSYHPWSFHLDSGIEFENTRVASEILNAPPPIGYTSNTFRCAFIPGRPLSRISPFTGVEPEERNITLARETAPAALVGLWRLLEDVYMQMHLLHERRFTHGDMETHNIIVCTAPIRTFLIDFEGSQIDCPERPKQWEERRRRDLAEILKTAIYIQCALGRQEGGLAEESFYFLPTLFRNPDPFQSTLKAVGLNEAD